MSLLFRLHWRASVNRIEGVVIGAGRIEALAELKAEKLARCLGKGRDAEWERIGSGDH